MLPGAHDVSPVGRPFLLSDAQLRRSVAVDASERAMARVLSKLESGAPIRIGVLGSSVAMSGGCQAEYQPHLRCAQFDGLQVKKRFARGYGVVDDEMKGLLHNSDRPVRGFILQLLDAINATWPHREHRVINSAVDAWTAKAIEPCLLSNEALLNSDLLLLELGSQSWHSSQAAASERIVRKLLARASGPPPAMVMVTTRQWCGRSVHGLRRGERPVLLRTWEGIEDIFASFCGAYGLACLSLRDAIFHDVVASLPNFTVADVAADCLHPEQSRFGYHYMADMLIHWLKRSWRRYREGGGTPTKAIVDPPRPLPPALLPGNRGSAGRMVWRCYDLPATPATGDLALPNAPDGAAEGPTAVARARRAVRGKLEVAWQAETGGAAAVSDTASCDALRRCVLRAAKTGDGTCLRGRGHWQHCTRALAPRAVNKPGIVSVLPGAAMRLVVDTTAPVVGNGSALPQAALALTYLASYERMGLGVVSCVSGCSCAPRTIDALHFAQPATAAGGGGGGAEGIGRNVSIATIAEIPVSSARSCVVRLENKARGGGAIGGSPNAGGLQVAKWKLLQVRVGWELGL